MLLYTSLIVPAILPFPHTQSLKELMMAPLIVSLSKGLRTGHPDIQSSAVIYSDNHCSIVFVLSAGQSADKELFVFI